MSIELRAFGFALLAGIFSVGTLFTYAELQSPPTLEASSRPSVSESYESPNVLNGSLYFQTSCTRCHGQDAEGKGSAPSLHSEDMSDSDMKNEIENGYGQMPAFKNIYTPAQVDALIAFIRTLK